MSDRAAKMRAFSGPTIMEQPATSNRRQPVRQTRTNPARIASSNAQAQGGASAPTPDIERNASPGFFPALTHYTDAIAALPKEMIRHNTMLKEVDAKIYGPEARLTELVNIALKEHPQPRSTTFNSQVSASASLNSDTCSIGPPPAPEPVSHPEMSSQAANGNPSDPSYSRRLQFHNIRTTLLEMLTTLDEKNHVINTAIDCLDKQKKRCNSSFPHIQDEISEEARLGSMTHWAYTDKAAEKKGIIAGERTRRAEADAAALRSESRREALAAKKPRNQHVDSDFDDGKAVGKKAQNSGKGRRIGDPGLGNGVGLGIVNGAAPPSKRRKVERPTATSLGGKGAMASVYGSNPSSGRGGAGSPKDTSVNELAGKKRGRGGAVTNGSGRRRAGTNASPANSPSLVSSPVVGTFTVTKDKSGRSPAPATLQRLPSSRARQNSTQNVTHPSRNRSSSTNHKGANGTGLYGTTADIDKVSGVTGRTTGAVKSSMKETVNAKGEHLVEDIGTGDVAGEVRGALVVGNRSSDRAMKREDSVNGNGRTRPPSISVSIRGGNSKQPSKAATPVNTSFSESQRTRASREIPLKRSHKKGAGLAAQAAAAAAAQGDEGYSAQGDEDEDDGNSQRYCLCDGPGFGQMVGCDGDKCPREWFHLACVGLAEPPGKRVKWYCDDCKENLKDSKFKNGGAR